MQSEKNELLKIVGGWQARSGEKKLFMQKRRANSAMVYRHEKTRASKQT